MALQQSCICVFLYLRLTNNQVRWTLSKADFCKKKVLFKVKSVSLFIGIFCWKFNFNINSIWMVPTDEFSLFSCVQPMRDYQRSFGVPAFSGGQCQIRIGFWPPSFMGFNRKWKREETGNLVRFAQFGPRDWEVSLTNRCQ